MSIPHLANLALSRFLPRRSNNSRRGGPQEAAEAGALHVARYRAGGGMPQAIAHSAQSADRTVEFVRLGRESLSLDARPAVRKHVERLEAIDISKSFAILTSSRLEVASP